ncbi:histidine kinase dimerization/phospho-acceptor domain-containing protein [Terrilactibacillus sp. S3-3]|nr:histidine kinase dimerization/phospho-acceptor domain-containing protein [Terrilactibacillus sp. S3-3]
MFNKLQRKLALTYSLAFFATLAVIFFILFLIFRSMIYHSVGWEINDIAKDQQNEFQQMHTISGTPFQSSIYLSAFLSNDGKDIVYKGALTKSLRQTFQKKIDRGTATGTLDFFSRNGEQMHLIYAMKPIVKGNKKIGHILVVKDIARTHEQIEHWFFLILFMIGLLTAGLSIIISHFLAKRAVRPVKKNFDKQRAFVADASHELRTPLSVFSASLEFFEAEEKERMSESSKETLADFKRRGPRHEHADQPSAFFGQSRSRRFGTREKPLFAGGMYQADPLLLSSKSP